METILTYGVYHTMYMNLKYTQLENTLHNMFANLDFPLNLRNLTRKVLKHLRSLGVDVACETPLKYSWCQG